MCGFDSSKISKKKTSAEEYLNISTQACLCMAMETSTISVSCFEGLGVPITVIDFINFVHIKY